MPDEIGAKVSQAAEGAPQAEGHGDGEKPSAAFEGEPERVSRPDERGASPRLSALADAGSPREPAEADPINSAGAEPLKAATHAVPGSVADALDAAAEQIKRDRGADAGDQAALAQALRTFLDTLAGQNVPTRSEFRDLAARLDRLSSQYAKGR